MGKRLCTEVVLGPVAYCDVAYENENTLTQVWIFLCGRIDKKAVLSLRATAVLVIRRP